MLVGYEIANPPDYAVRNEAFSPSGAYMLNYIGIRQILTSKFDIITSNFGLHREP